MPQFDPTHYLSQFFWLVIVLSMAYCFIKYYLMPRFDAIDRKRQTLRAEDHEHIENCKKRIQLVHESCESSLKKVRGEAAEILENARIETEKLRNEQLHSLDNEVSARFHDFNEQLSWYQKAFFKDFDRRIDEIMSLAIKRVDRNEDDKG